MPRGAVQVLDLDGLDLAEKQPLPLRELTSRYRPDLAVAVLLRVAASRLAAHPEEPVRVGRTGWAAVLSDRQDPDRVVWRILPGVLGRAWVAWLGLQQEISPGNGGNDEVPGLRAHGPESRRYLT